MRKRQAHGLRWARAQIALVLLGSVGAFLLRLVSHQSVLPGWPASPSVAVLYPLAQSLHVMHADFREVRIPLWHPWLGLGVPLLPLWEARMVLANPLMWLFAGFDAAVRLRVTVAMSLMLAAIAFWCFAAARRYPAPIGVIGTLLYTFNPWTLGNVWNGRLDIGLGAICFVWALGAVLHADTDKRNYRFRNYYIAAIRLAPISFVSGAFAWACLFVSLLGYSCALRRQPHGVKAFQGKGLGSIPKLILGGLVLCLLVILLSAVIVFPTTEFQNRSVVAPCGLPNYSSGISRVTSLILPSAVLATIATETANARVEEGGGSALAHMPGLRHLGAPYFGLVFAVALYTVLRFLGNYIRSLPDLRNSPRRTMLTTLRLAGVVVGLWLVASGTEVLGNIGRLTGIEVLGLGVLPIAVCFGVAILVMNALDTAACYSDQGKQLVGVYASLAAAYFAVAIATAILPREMWGEHVASLPSVPQTDGDSESKKPTAQSALRIPHETEFQLVRGTALRQAVLAVLFALSFASYANLEGRRRVLWLLSVLTLADLRFAASPWLALTPREKVASLACSTCGQSGGSSRIVVVTEPSCRLHPLLRTQAVLNPSLSALPANYAQALSLCPIISITGNQRVSNKTLVQFLASIGMCGLLVDPEHETTISPWRNLFRLRDAVRLETYSYHCVTLDSVGERSYVRHRLTEVASAREGVYRTLAQEWQGEDIFVVGLSHLSSQARVALTATSQPPVSTGRARVLWDTGNDIGLECSAQLPGLAVLADTAYPGWRVWVNGKPQEVLCASGLLRAVYVSAGNSRIRFVYAPASYRLGCFVTLLTLAILAFIEFHRRVEAVPQCRGKS